MWRTRPFTRRTWLGLGIVSVSRYLASTRNTPRRPQGHPGNKPGIHRPRENRAAAVWSARWIPPGDLPAEQSHIVGMPRTCSVLQSRIVEAPLPRAELHVVVPCNGPVDLRPVIAVIDREGTNAGGLQQEATFREQRGQSPFGHVFKHGIGKDHIEAMVRSVKVRRLVGDPDAFEGGSAQPLEQVLDQGGSRIRLDIRGLYALASGERHEDRQRQMLSAADL